MKNNIAYGIFLLIAIILSYIHIPYINCSAISTVIIAILAIIFIIKGSIK